MKNPKISPNSPCLIPENLSQKKPWRRSGCDFIKRIHPEAVHLEWSFFHAENFIDFTYHSQIVHDTITNMRYNAVMKKILSIIFIIIGAGSVGGYILFNSGKAKSSFEIAEIERGDLSENISCTGNLKLRNSVVVNFKISGTVVKVQTRSAPPS